MTALKSMACKLLLLVFSSLFFTPVFAENLLQVYQQALKNDAQIRASEAGYLAVLEKRPQALSALKPRIDLGGSATYNLQQIERTGLRDGGSAFLNFGYNLNLTKPLIHKEIQAQIGQVNATILQAKANLERDRQNLIIRVAEAYFQYLKAKEGKIFATAEK
ncbi:MAG TPA: type I secretion protein TolC, partial [Leucothrix sp.]|nr:type I secretion protein TolC [Leucothrix sp.]